MYKQFGSEQVFAASGQVGVDIFASTRPDGTLTVMVINLSDYELRMPLLIDGKPISSADLWLLDVTHNAENLGPQTFPADGKVILPAQSASLYIIAP